MKLLTANFLTCAIKTCKTSPSSFPLHFQDAELAQSELEYNPTFLLNILPRLDWEAIRTTAAELGFSSIPTEKPSSRPETATTATAEAGGPSNEEEADRMMRQLHTILLETEVMEGKMVCGNCGHEYRIKEGIANFLLPAHLV